MQPSQQFLDQLHDTFGGRFRVRWSDKAQEWQLEQRVANPSVIPPPIDPDDHTYDTYDDNWIRARDGYYPVMSLRNGDRMPCPVCGLTVKVPIMQTRESTCEHCRFKGRDGRYIAAFYPFNHILIEHLLDLDPLRGGVERSRKRIRDRQLARQAKADQDAIEQAEFGVIDNRLQAFEVPHVGRGTKRAPVKAKDVPIQG